MQKKEGTEGRTFTVAIYMWSYPKKVFHDGTTVCGVISRCTVLVFNAPSAPPASFPVEKLGHMISFLCNTIQQPSLVSHLNVSFSISAKLCGKT